jgi:adenylate cyclase
MIPFENEEKYLPNSDAWRPLVTEKLSLIQGYLINENGKLARIRITTKADGTRIPKFEIKLPPRAEGTPEIPFPPISIELADALMVECGNRIITKIRHHVPIGDRMFEIDVFEGRHAPLITIELERDGPAAETMQLPEWVGRNVTADYRFSNIWLSEHDIEPDMLGFQS